MPLRIPSRLSATLAVLVVYTVIRFGILVVRPPGYVPNDYMNFHKASIRLENETGIYQAYDDSPFKYSPTFLLLFKNTFHRLPPAWGWALWCAGSIALYAWAVRKLWRIGLERAPRLPSLTTAALITSFAVFGWHGYLEHFSYGQGDMAIFSLFILSALAANRKELWGAFLSVLVMSLILVTKPQAAILLAYFAVCRRWRVLGAIGAATSALLLAPTLVWGWPKLLSQFHLWMNLLVHQHYAFLTGSLNQSPAAIVARLSGHREVVSTLNNIQVLTGVAITLLALLKIRLNPRKITPEINVWLICTTLMFYALFTPLSWRWSTFVWMPVGVLVAAEYFRDRKLRASLKGRFLGGLLVVFALNGVFLQRAVATAIGVAEVDHLSYYGLYGLGNALLFAGLMLGRPKFT